MATHTKYTLRSASIAQVLNLPLTIAAPETAGAKGLVAGQDGEVFDFLIARTAAVGAVITYEAAIAEEEEVRIGVEEGAACVAAKAVDVPAITSWRTGSAATE
jgi:hypothetical protein